MAHHIERLKVNLVKGEDRKQAVIRGQIEIPYSKPDLDQVLSKEVTAKVKDTTIVPDKVIVNGVLHVQVMYVAFDPAQSVHTFEGDIPFTTFVEVPSVKPGMETHVEIRVEDVSLTPVKKEPRKFEVTAVAEVFVKIFQVEEMEILTQTPPSNVALETKDITVEHLVGEKAVKQIIVSETFEVPEEKPDVEKIIKVDAKAEVTETRLIANKVIVDGEVRLQILYTAMKPEQTVHDLHHTIKFSDFIEVPDAEPGMNVKVIVEVEDAQVHPVIDPALHADVILKLIAFVSETRTLQDVPTQLKNETGFVKRRLKIEQQVGAAEKQVVILDTQPVPDAKPDVSKVLESKVDKTKIVETKILDGKVIVRGELEIKVVYVGALPNQAVHALHRTLTFSTFVEIPGAMPGMNVDVKVDAEYINVETRVEGVRVEAVLKVRATVTDQRQVDVYVPEEEVLPVHEVKEYVVQPGDTLSNIAARFGITVAMILAENPQITDPDNLVVGQVIKLPCVALG